MSRTARTGPEFALGVLVPLVVVLAITTVAGVIFGLNEASTAQAFGKRNAQLTQSLQVQGRALAKASVALGIANAALHSANATQAQLGRAKQAARRNATRVQKVINTLLGAPGPKLLLQRHCHRRNRRCHR